MINLLAGKIDVLNIEFTLISYKFLMIVFFLCLMHLLRDIRTIALYELDHLIGLLHFYCILAHQFGTL